jgi:hypothetical protein
MLAHSLIPPSIDLQVFLHALCMSTRAYWILIAVACNSGHIPLRLMPVSGWHGLCFIERRVQADHSGKQQRISTSQM